MPWKLESLINVGFRLPVFDAAFALQNLLHVFYGLLTTSCLEVYTKILEVGLK